MNNNALNMIGDKSSSSTVENGTCSSNSSYRRNKNKRPQLVLDSIKSQKDIYYFSIGSNMSRTKLENRSICGSKILIDEMIPAVVHNYRLVFNLPGIPPLEPAMASIDGPIISNDTSEDSSTPSHKKNRKQFLSYSSNDKDELKPQEINAECHGALIRLSSSDYEKMIKSEGFDSESNKKQQYEEIVVTAIPYDNDHNAHQFGLGCSSRKRKRRPIKCIALRASDHIRLKEESLPSRRYMQILCCGAKELGLHESYQRFLQNYPTYDIQSSTFKKFALLNFICMCTFRFDCAALACIPSIQNWIMYRIMNCATIASSDRFSSELKSSIKVSMQTFFTILTLIPGSIFGYMILMYITRFGTKPKNISPMMKPMVNEYWYYVNDSTSNISNSSNISLYDDAKNDSSSSNDIIQATESYLENMSSFRNIMQQPQLNREAFIDNLIDEQSDNTSCSSNNDDAPQNQHQNRSDLRRGSASCSGNNDDDQYHRHTIGRTGQRRGSFARQA